MMSDFLCWISRFSENLLYWANAAFNTSSAALLTNLEPEIILSGTGTIN